MEAPNKRVAVVSWLNYLNQPIRFFHSRFGEACHGPTFEFIYYNSHPTSYIPWFPLLYTSVACIIISFLGHFYPVKSQGRISEWLGSQEKKIWRNKQLYFQTLRVNTIKWMHHMNSNKTSWEKRLNGNYKRMLCAVLKKSWKQYPQKMQWHNHLPLPIQKSFK